MKRCIKVIPLVFLVSASLMLSCAGEDTGESGVVVAKTFFDIPRCNRLRVGIVYYVVDTEEFFYCDGRELLSVDLSGQDGQDGQDGEDGQDGQDGTSCTVTNDGAGTVTIACEDGTFATISDGQDGQDGTSCTVTRNDAAGTTTVSCEDGTVAVVQDGEDGQDGQDGTSCTIVDTSAGASITCGTETVTITDGQDGSSCSASTDASGAVTISCDDGTSATIPAGDGGDAVALICGLLLSNPSLVPPAGLECPPACGDGTVDPGEECDPPNGVTCDASCQSIDATIDAFIDLDGTLTCNVLATEFPVSAQLVFLADGFDQTISLDAGAVEFTSLCGQVVESLQVVVSVDGATPMTLRAAASGLPVVVDENPILGSSVCSEVIPLEFVPVPVSSVTSPTVEFQITDIIASGTGGGLSDTFAWEAGNPECTLSNNDPFLVSAQ